MFNKNNKKKGLFALFIALFMVSTSISFAGDDGNSAGKNLFKAKCSTCHAPHRDMTGPALFHMRDQWKKDGHGDLIYDWVHNWKKTAATHPYAKEVSNWSPAAMQTFPNLTKDQINSIFDYIDSTPEPGAKKATTGGGTGTVSSGGSAPQKDNGLGAIWYILGAVFLVIIFSAGAIKRQLRSLDGEVPEEKRIGSKKWMWKNKKWLGMGGFVVTVGIIVYALLVLYDVDVMTAYHPSQPITFRHDIHAGINGINCKYCHNGANKSKTSGIPTLNVCMNCHKLVHGENEFQKKEIAKLYDAVGFSPKGGGKFSGKQHPIVWNKVHNLPDFVFFSHKQHVVVGGIDCKQCHGDMTKRHKTAEVMPVSELNKIKGNINLGDHQTLTMGWCITCHEKKAVSKGPLSTRGGYYEEIHKRLLKYDKKDYAKFLKDGKVTEKELGGWECGKCHY